MKSEVMIFLSFSQLIVTLSVRWSVGKAFYTHSIVSCYFILSLFVSTLNSRYIENQGTDCIFAM